jgi:hypothetical protein
MMFHPFLDRILTSAAADVRANTPGLRFSFLRRRWVFYALTTTVLVVTIAAVAFGVMASRAVRQRDAVAALRALQCDVFYDYEPPAPWMGAHWGPWPDAHWKKRGTPKGPKWLRSLVGDDFLDRAVMVRLVASQVDDAIPYLERLPHLKEVYVFGGPSSPDIEYPEEPFQAVERLRRELPTIHVDFTGIIPIVG